MKACPSPVGGRWQERVSGSRADVLETGILGFQKAVFDSFYSQREYKLGKVAHKNKSQDSPHLVTPSYWNESQPCTLKAKESLRFVRNDTCRTFSPKEAVVHLRSLGVKAIHIFGDSTQEQLAHTLQLVKVTPPICGAEQSKDINCTLRVLLQGLRCLPQNYDVLDQLRPCFVTPIS